MTTNLETVSWESGEFEYDPERSEVPGSSKASGVSIPPHMSVLMRFLLHRLNANMEAQVIITGKSAVRGLGKTQLGMNIAQKVHECVVCSSCGYIWFYQQRECPRCESSSGWLAMPEWTKQRNGFLDVGAFKQACMTYRKQVMLFDEIEHSADKRRSMASENVELSQALMKLRYRNNIMIATLPVMSVLDDRVPRLADIWLNVVRRGDAVGYHLWLNDFPPYSLYRIRMQLENGWYETVHWKAIDDDEEYQALSREKEATMEEGDVELDAELRQVVNNKVSKQKVEWTEKLLANTEEAQVDIADSLGMSQKWVSNVNRGRNSLQDSDSDRYPIRG